MKQAILSLRIPQAVLDRLADQAESRRTSTAQLIRDAILASLDQDQSEARIKLMMDEVAKKAVKETLAALQG